MEKTHISVFFIISAGSLLLALENKQYCFRFRWSASGYNTDPKKYNCSMFEGVPCSEPLINNTDYPPDTHTFWEQEDSTVLCDVSSGDVCIKYTYTFMNNVVNVTRYCGKMVENDGMPVTSGCYPQNVNGYVIEACACESQRGKEPCNGTTKTKYSIPLFIISLLLMNFLYQ